MLRSEHSYSRRREEDISSGDVTIELRSHDFNEVDKNITDLEEKGFYQKSGTNLTLPD